MKIKYYKITKFNVVFNLKKMEKVRAGKNGANIEKKYFARNLMCFLVIIKSGKKNQRNKTKFVPHFPLPFRLPRPTDSFSTAVHYWVNKFTVWDYRGSGKSAEKNFNFVAVILNEKRHISNHSHTEWEVDDQNQRHSQTDPSGNIWSRLQQCLQKCELDKANIFECELPEAWFRFGNYFYASRGCRSWV